MTAPAGPHYGHQVWDDEDGETYWVHGHIPPRRAIAAVNHYARTEGGLVNLCDEHGAPLSYITVRHRYFRPEPNYANMGEDGWVPTTASDLWGKPFTEVSV